VRRRPRPHSGARPTSACRCTPAKTLLNEQHVAPRLDIGRECRPLLLFNRAQASNTPSAAWRPLSSSVQRPIALRPSLTTGLPFSRMRRPSRPEFCCAPPKLPEDLFIGKGSGARRLRFTTARKPCHTAIALDRSSAVGFSTDTPDLERLEDFLERLSNHFSAIASSSPPGLLPRISLWHTVGLDPTCPAVAGRLKIFRLHLQSARAETLFTLTLKTSLMNT
jgi:hypothetical protein